MCKFGELRQTPTWFPSTNMSGTWLADSYKTTDEEQKRQNVFFYLLLSFIEYDFF